MKHAPLLPETHDPLVALRQLRTGLQWAKLARSRRLWSGETQTFTISSIDTGSSVWRIGGIDRLTRTGGLRLKRPGEHFRTVSVEEPSAMTVMRIDSERMSHFGPAFVARAFAIAQVDSVALLRTFQQLNTTDDVEEALVQLLVALAQVTELPTHASGRLGKRADVARVRAILDRNISQAIRLQDLAQAADLHPVTLVRLFRHEYGVPPHAYLTERRIEAAQSLLVAGVSPSEVALAVGFCDQSHLNRHFKRRTGLTPSVFRQTEQTATRHRPS